MGKRILQVGGGVVLGLAAAGLLLLPGLQREASPDDPYLLPAPWAVEQTELTDHRGRTVGLPGSFDGITAVFFGYTHCPDVCPLTLARLAGAAEDLEPEEASRFRIVFVSVDPARDTPERIAEFVEGLGPSVVGMTAPPARLESTLAAWGIYAGRAEPDPSSPPAPDDEPYLVDHSARTFLVGPDGRVVGSFPHSTDRAAMTATLQRLLRGSGIGR